MAKTFTDLVGGEKGYAASDSLVLLRCQFDHAKTALTKEAVKLLQKIEMKTNMPVRKFIIGRTFAEEKKNKKGERIKFELEKISTWNLDRGVDSEWKHHYEPDGYDGLILLCAVTHDRLPLPTNGVAAKNTTKNKLFDQQQYALALEAQLIHYFMFVIQDTRLDKTCLYPSKLTEETPFAGVLYLAYKLRTNRDIWELFEVESQDAETKDKDADTESEETETETKEKDAESEDTDSDDADSESDSEVSDITEFETRGSDATCVISGHGDAFENIGGRKIICGREVENTVIAFLKQAQPKSGSTAKMFLNFKPSKGFIKAAAGLVNCLDSSLAIIVPSQCRNLSITAFQESDRKALKKLLHV